MSTATRWYLSMSCMAARCASHTITERSKDRPTQQCTRQTATYDVRENNRVTPTSFSCVLHFCPRSINIGDILQSAKHLYDLIPISMHEMKETEVLAKLKKWKKKKINNSRDVEGKTIWKLGILIVLHSTAKLRLHGFFFESDINAFILRISYGMSMILFVDGCCCLHSVKCFAI